MATSLPSFNEDTEINDDELEKEPPQMNFYATGDDGNVIQLHKRMASVPISFGGKQFQQALEEEIKDYTDDQIVALAPFELCGRGIAGIDEMSNILDDNRVFFGLLQVQIGEGTFARYKNIFIHFQGEKMKAIQRARANKQLAVAKELIGHTHAPLIITNKESCSVEGIFNELKRVFVGDNIAYKGKGKQTDLNTLKINYKLRMERAKKEAEAERKRLIAEKAKLEKEAKAKALQEEKERMEQLKIEAERKKYQMEQAKKLKAEKERRLRHEKEEKERLERKRKKEEEEKKRMEEELKKNPNAKLEDLKKTKKKKKSRRRKKKKKDDWCDDKPWTPQRILAAVHATTSPFNWCLFKPSQKELKPIKWGHGSLSAVRAELKDDEVQYGLMRLSFGTGRFKRSHWVYFLWTPDTMSHEYKKGNKRMKHVSFSGQMSKLLAPWTVSLTCNHLSNVTIKHWIMRVKKTVVVDGSDELSEEAFLAAMEEEEKWILELQKVENEKNEKRKQEEEIQKMELMRVEAKKRKERSMQVQSTEFTKLQLKAVNEAIKNEIYKTPTPDEDGNFYVDAYGNIEAMKQKEKNEKMNENKKVDNDDKKSDENEIKNNEKNGVLSEDEEEEYDESSDDVREPSPEPVIELSAEELAILEEERKKKEKEELAKRTENELKYRRVLQAKMVLESVELCKRTGERLCWVLFAPRNR